LQLGYGFKLRHSAVAVIERTVLRTAIHIADGDCLPMVVELVNALAILIVGKRGAVPAVRDGKAAARRGTRVFGDADHAIRRGVRIAVLHLVSIVILCRSQVPVGIVAVGARFVVGICNAGKPAGRIVSVADIQPVRRINCSEPAARIAKRRRAACPVYNARNLPAAVVIDVQRIAVAVLKLA